jgi:hypothetical protein
MAGIAEELAKKIAKSAQGIASNLIATGTETRDDAIVDAAIEAQSDMGFGPLDIDEDAAMDLHAEVIRLLDEMEDLKEAARAQEK